MANTRVKARHALGRRIAWCAVSAIGMLLLPVQGHSEGEQDTVGQLATFNSTLPASFNMLKTDGLDSIYTSCMGRTVNNTLESFKMLFAEGNEGCKDVLGTMQALLTNVSLKTECPEAAGFDPEEVSCDNFVTDNSFAKTKYKFAREANCKALSSMACKKSKFAAIKGELDCLSKAADNLTQQVNALSDAYTENLSKMSDEVSSLNQLGQERKSQFEFVMKHLGSGDATDHTSLLALKQQTEAMLNAMPTEVQTIKEQQINISNQRKSLEEQIQSRTMALTKTCFNQPKAKFRCGACNPKEDKTCNPKNPDPPVSAQQYVMCRYRQNQTISTNGRIESDTLTGVDANDRTSGLENVMTRIMGEIPSTAKLPTSPQDYQKTMDEPVGLLTVADVESQYGDELASYNGKGLDIHNFVVEQFGSCQYQASRTVEREKTRKNSQIGQAQEGILRDERATKKGVSELLQKYSRQWNENMRGLTGMNLPLNTTNCESANPDVQLSCLESVKKNMQGLLAGTSANSQVHIVIPGNSVKFSGGPVNTEVPFNCSGLDGCITAYKNLKEKLQIQMNTIDKTKKDYVRQANNSVQQFTSKMKQTLSTQSQALSSRKTELNNALVAMGLPPIKIDSYEADRSPDEYDENGLVKAPTNLLAYMGSRMNPPMLNLSGGSFTDSLGGIVDGTKDLETKLADAQKAQTKLGNLPGKCTGNIVDKRSEDLQGGLEKLMMDCGDAADVKCDPTAYETLSNSLDAAIGGVDTDESKKLKGALQGYSCLPGSTVTGEDRASSGPPTLAEIEAAKNSPEVAEACSGSDPDRLEISSTDPTYKSRVEKARSKYELCLLGKATEAAKTKKKENQEKVKTLKSCAMQYNGALGKIQKLGEARKSVDELNKAGSAK